MVEVYTGTERYSDAAAAAAGHIIDNGPYSLSIVVYQFLI